MKTPDLPVPLEGAVSFLSFDDECFYRHWALDMGQDDGARLETVFDCSSAAGLVAAVTSGSGRAPERPPSAPRSDPSSLAVPP